MLQRFLICILLLPAGAQALDLSEALRLAEQNDVVFQAARANYDAGIESRSQATSAVLPTINFDAFVGRTSTETSNSTSTSSPNGTSDFSSNGYSLSLNQTIYNQALFDALDQGSAQSAKALADYENARQDLVVRVARAYFDLLAAEDNHSFAVAEKEAIARQLEQTKGRFDAGLIAITDVKQSQAQYDIAVAKEIVASNAIANAREALRTIINQSDEALLPVQENLALATPEPDDIKKWEDTALENNLQLRAAKYSAEAARSAYDVSHAGHYPTLSLNAEHSFTSSDGSTISNAFGGRDTTQDNIQLQLNVPLYSGGFTSSLSRQRNAEYQAAKSLYMQQQRLTVQQVRNAFLGIKATISQVVALKQALASTETAVEAAEEGFKAGTRNSVDVLFAQRELYASERDYARARYDYLLNILELKRAAGTLTGADLQEMNQWLKR
jgi:outer membrane protein